MLTIIEDQSDISQVSVSSLLYCVSRVLGQSPPRLHSVVCRHWSRQDVTGSLFSTAGSKFRLISDISLYL